MTDTAKRRYLVKSKYLTTSGDSLQEALERFRAVNADEHRAAGQLAVTKDMSLRAPRGSWERPAD
jgi:hypothetical protein